MKKLLGKKTAEVEVEIPTYVKPSPPSYAATWAATGLNIVENDFGMLFTRKVFYPSDYQHGHYTLGQLFNAIERWEEAGVDHPFATTFDDTLVFFDTETTGLKGTGTLIFLLGVLEEKRDGFELTQYVLADPSNEAALLFESKFWQRAMTVVSYNGKSFDWPQLQMRWTLNQQHIPRLREQRQIDLLHSTKRLWKDDLERMKLTQVEQQKLGFFRQGDIPGHLAPIIYFDAVKSGNAQTLMKVLQHNEWDLLSLITLYVHSTELLMNEVKDESATTYTNVGKWYGDLKQRDMSTALFEEVTEQFDEWEASVAQFLLGYERKRNGLVEEAIRAFEKSLAGIAPKKQQQAYEQLAILHEHRTKDLVKALYYAREGLSRLENLVYKKMDTKSTLQQNWEKRIERLLRKINVTQCRK